MGGRTCQPGTLSWVFPSFDAAMKAASALRNATQWAIMGGADATGVGARRAQRLIIH